MLFRLLTLALLISLALTSLALQAQVSKKPDLDVLFIEQWPAYPGYNYSCPGNLPVLVKPGTGTVRLRSVYCKAEGMI